MRKIIGAAVGAMALSVGGLAPAAFAEDTAGEGFILAASPWKTLDTGPGTVWTPGLEHDSELSEFTGATSVDLIWSADVAGASLGTSAETTNLGAAVTAGAEISVDYELVDGADPAAGSVRLFAVVGAAPMVHAAAPDDGTTSGTLSITAAADGTVGHLGLVYDTSNGGVEGTVRFSDLTVDGEPVIFVPPAEPTLSQPSCEDPVGTLTIPDAPGYAYTLEGSAAPAGEYDAAPGDHEVMAWLAADDSVLVHGWVFTADEPTGCPGDDDGTDDGGESGTDDGGESGTDDGGEAGTDDGGESGTDDGGESGTDDGAESGGDDGSPSPTPSADDCDAYVGSAAWCDPAHGDYDCSQIGDAHRPVQLVDASNDPFLLDSDDDGAGCEATGDDDGTDDGSGDDDGTGGDDGSLPDTGAGSSLLWAGTVLLVLGGLAALFARHRRTLAG